MFTSVSAGPRVPRRVHNSRHHRRPAPGRPTFGPRSSIVGAPHKFAQCVSLPLKSCRAPHPARNRCAMRVCGHQRHSEHERTRTHTHTHDRTSARTGRRHANSANTHTHRAAVRRANRPQYLLTSTSRTSTHARRVPPRAHFDWRTH